MQKRYFASLNGQSWKSLLHRPWNLFGLLTLTNCSLAVSWAARKQSISFESPQLGFYVGLFVKSIAALLRYVFWSQITLNSTVLFYHCPISNRTGPLQYKFLMIIKDWENQICYSINFCNCLSSGCSQMKGHSAWQIYPFWLYSQKFLNSFDIHYLKPSNSVQLIKRYFLNFHKLHFK